MVYPTRLALSTLLLLCIGTGRATWIDSVAVIDAVSEPEPQELENASDPLTGSKRFEHCQIPQCPLPPSAPPALAQPSPPPPVLSQRRRGGREAGERC